LTSEGLTELVRVTEVVLPTSWVSEAVPPAVLELLV
jgi:hypothetical protein